MAMKTGTMRISVSASSPKSSGRRRELAQQIHDDVGAEDRPDEEREQGAGDFGEFHHLVHVMPHHVSEEQAADKGGDEAVAADRHRAQNRPSTPAPVPPIDVQPT